MTPLVFMFCFVFSLLVRAFVSGTGRTSFSIFSCTHYIIHIYVLLHLDQLATITAVAVLLMRMFLFSGT